MPVNRRSIGEVRLGLREQVDAVEQHLRLETLGVEVGKVLAVDRVIIVGHRAELVGPAPGDDTDHRLEIDH